MYEAIILAGGFGTRLREAVPDLPKPMAPVAGKPFLAWQLEYLIKRKVTRFIFSVGYKAQAIRDYFGSAYQGAEIVYAEEAEPLGTGGAIKFALMQANQNRVFVFNGDTLCDVSLDELRKLNAGNINGVGIFVKEVSDAQRYGSIDFDKVKRLVTNFGEKSKSGPGYINAGIYDVPKNLFASLEVKYPFSFEKEVLEKLVAVNLYAAMAGNFFIDIGIKSDFDAAQILIPQWFEKSCI